MYTEERIALDYKRGDNLGSNTFVVGPYAQLAELGCCSLQIR